MLHVLSGLLRRTRLPAFSRRRPAAFMPDPIVTDLSKKLWAGFSRHARNHLDRLVNGPVPGAQNMLAAWELAKFHAFEGQWHQCLQYLEGIHVADRCFLHSIGAGHLYVEALLACGRPDDAAYYAHHEIDKKACCAEWICALSNVIAKREDSQKGNRESLRLALLNRLYAAAGLGELGLVDFSRGFVFGNLAAAEPRLPDVQSPEKTSVLMTVFNAERYVATSITSILNQAWRNLELIVVDDASTDASWAIISRLAGEDPRIVHGRNETRMGVYRTRNKALSLATGEFVTSHGSEEWAHPQMLGAQVQAMLRDPGRKLSFRNVACVAPEMSYGLRFGPDHPRYVCKSFRSCLIRKWDLDRLDKWDAVVAHADEELANRAKAVWGEDAIREFLSGVPVAICLEHAGGNPEEGAELQSATSSARREYAKQAEFWRQNILVPAYEEGRTVQMDRSGLKRPFPIPGELSPDKPRQKQHYDLVLISDLALLGGTRRCNEGYIAAAMNLGMKIGLWHWPRFDLMLVDDIAREYRLLSYHDNVDILAAEDTVSADLVVIHHPPIMKYVPDNLPGIDTARIAILVNQLPRRFGGGEYYAREDVESDCLRLFNVRPVWIPISPLVRRILLESGFAPLAKEDWIPPLGNIVSTGRGDRARRSGSGDMPVVGRHSRDHPTKWPELEEDLRAAYCAGSELPVRFLGGASFARRILGDWPSNWEEFAFDSVAVHDFLDGLDFFVHFTHSAYVEEFGRNVMEAMAAGIPAVLPFRFKEVFGDAAFYSEPDDVEELIRTIWRSGEAYAKQVEKGFHYVREFASTQPVERRIREATQGDL